MCPANRSDQGAASPNAMLTHTGDNKVQKKTFIHTLFHIQLPIMKQLFPQQYTLPTIYLEEITCIIKYSQILFISLHRKHLEQSIASLRCPTDWLLHQMLFSHRHWHCPPPPPKKEKRQHWALCSGKLKDARRSQLTHSVFFSVTYTLVEQWQVLVCYKKICSDRKIRTKKGNGQRECTCGQWVSMTFFPFNIALPGLVGLLLPKLVEPFSRGLLLLLKHYESHNDTKNQSKNGTKHN